MNLAYIAASGHLVLFEQRLWIQAALNMATIIWFAIFDKIIPF